MDIINKILNNKSLRKGVAESIPLIQRLENSGCLKNLKLTSFMAEDIIKANYEAVASQNIYPHTRARLMEKGVIKKSEIGSAIKRDKFGNLMDHEQLVLYNYGGGAHTQIWLKIFNPNYKR